MYYMQGGDLSKTQELLKYDIIYVFLVLNYNTGLKIEILQYKSLYVIYASNQHSTQNTSPNRIKLDKLFHDTKSKNCIKNEQFAMQERIYIIYARKQNAKNEKNLLNIIFTSYIWPYIF